MAETQTVYAKSAFSDPVNILNFIVVLSTLPDVHSLIPPRYYPTISAVAAVATLALHTFFTPHPVTVTIGPGEVKPIEIKKLEATKAGSEDPEKLPPSITPKQE